MALPNTHFGAEGIARILDGKKNLFFAGIGGVSMNSLAHISFLRGFRVSGYDRTPSPLTRSLEAMGIPMYYEADEAHVQDCDALIYTVAMPASNPEYAYAASHGIPLISRADYLGYIMTGYDRRIGISGTHGKSTTTGMIAHILTKAGLDPTVSGGAAMKDTGTVDRIGGKEFFVFEACEYMDSFLDFNPTVAVTLNEDLDHVDYFHSIEQYRKSFTGFMNITGKEGFAVYNRRDENCRLSAAEYGGHAVSFGRNDPEARFSSANENTDSGYASFDVLENGSFAVHIQMQIPGEHAIDDALAAFAACSVSGVPADVIASGIADYEGICRRMEKLCAIKNGALLYSDYAHHPTEIAATLKGARAICRGKLRVIFQPHTFSRTAELFDGFVSAFAESGADEVILCEIYPARETNTYGVTSSALADAIARAGKPCHAAASFAEAADEADSACEAGDVVIVMGAGDVIAAADLLTAKYAR